MKIGMEMTGMLQEGGMLGDRGAYATNYSRIHFLFIFLFLYSFIQHQRRGAYKGSGAEFHTWVICVQRFGIGMKTGTGLSRVIMIIPFKYQWLCSVRYSCFYVHIRLNTKFYVFATQYLVKPRDWIQL